MLQNQAKLKSTIKRTLQSILGFDNFLFYFSRLTIKRLYQNKHEEEFVHFLSLLPTDGALLDIGANIGIMTVPLANRATNGHVFSFEPMPNNLKALKRIVKYYKLNNVTIFESALGNEPGELKMVMPIQNNVKMQGLCHVVDENNPVEGVFFTVPVKRLDDIPELQKADTIGGIKIDVENFEYEVLTGAKNLLLKHKPYIYCELWDNEKRVNTLNYLKNEIGYNIKIYDGKKLVPHTDQNVLNYFMVP
jgi:FkbM family methyltransferase